MVKYVSKHSLTYQVTKTQMLHNINICHLQDLKNNLIGTCPWFPSLLFLVRVVDTGLGLSQSRRKRSADI